MYLFVNFYSNSINIACPGDYVAVVDFNFFLLSSIGDTMSGEAESKGDVVVLDELTIKQRTKEFKSVQKSLHSKDFAVRLTALSKISGDSRYFSDGSCLPSFFESLAPTKVCRFCIIIFYHW